MSGRTVNANIGESNSPLDQQLWRRQGRQANHRVDGVHLWWGSVDECERKGVLSWIAAFDTRYSIVGMGRHCVVLMNRWPMVVLRMIVIAVGMRVQR
jgi:hypothetical protein